MSVPATSGQAGLLAAIAVTRLGLGGRVGEIAEARPDPRGWLISQITPAGVARARPEAPGSAVRLADLQAFQQLRKTAQMEGNPKSDPVRMAQMGLREDVEGDFLARAHVGATTHAAFAERWTLFWANHFTVSAVKQATAPLVGPFDDEVIRPHAFGRFEDMLVAASRHPAMLLYLDQAQSVGPNSLQAQRAAKNGRPAPGLNENLAREILELHTVGVAAGYSQADVTEFARALTGWAVNRPDQSPDPAGFLFRPNAHEPGPRTVMGRRYAEDGEAQAHAVLKDLAASPHTARHLAAKIARHFVSDQPPARLTDRLARTYQESDGRLDVVAQALVTAPDTWSPDQAKFKTPYEFLVSSWRAADVAPSDPGGLYRILTALGQRPFSAPSPKGWPEEAQAWAASDAIVKRMAWSEDFAARSVGQQDPGATAEAALGARLSPAVGQAIARAETRAEGLSILLMSPEFQRR